MSRRALVLLLLALANLSVFAVAEAAPGLAQADRPVVAVLDTGVGPGSSVLPGLDLVGGDADAADEHGHGTLVAARVSAACRECLILPVRVLSRNASAPWSRVAAGIVWAVDNGADVVNVSIAGDGGSPALRAAVAYAAARGVPVVAAAGNRGDARPQFPAAYEGVVGVAATNADGRLFRWSSRGAWVDEAAPGCTRSACGTSFAAPLVAARAAREVA
jgi:subtilisin family serine protease